jgi:two-component system, OmpR family, alkaline phosphatase synthesis response regulator PhoP
MRILVAEDNIAMANVIAFNLMKAGFDVLHVGSGDIAWKLLQQEEFDLLVTDYQMPGMNGGDLSRRMRQEPSLSEIPIVLLTAKFLELDGERCLDTLGVNAVMMKPFSPRGLVHMVQKLLSVASERENGG